MVRLGSHGLAILGKGCHSMARSGIARHGGAVMERIVLALQAKACRCSVRQSRMGSALSWMVPAMFGWALQGLAVAALKGWFRHVLAVRCEERPGRAVLECQCVLTIAPARLDPQCPGCVGLPVNKSPRHGLTWHGAYRIGGACRVSDWQSWMCLARRGEARIGAFVCGKVR